MGKSSQQTTQSSQSAPWAPAQPALQSILNSIGGQLGNYSPNATETNALQTLTNNSQNLPNYGTPAQNVTGGFFGGDPTGLLSPALSQYRNTLNPIANANPDPTQTPGMANVLSTIRNDVGNSINGMFAGAGRDGSGLNQQYLARGIAQGEAAPLLNQYNANIGNIMGAASGLYNAAGTTAGNIAGNQQQAFNLAGAVPGLANQSPTNVLAAQAAARGLPLNNLGMLENLTVPIAGLGSQNSGSSNTTNNPSLLSQIASGVNIFNGLFG